MAPGIARNDILEAMVKSVGDPAVWARGKGHVIDADTAVIAVHHEVMASRVELEILDS